MLPSRIRPLIALALICSGAGLAAVFPVAAGAAPGDDDTPVLLTPKGEREDGSDEQSFDKLRDAYYWSRLLSGDEQLTVNKAAKLRSKAVVHANGISKAAPAGHHARGRLALPGPQPHRPGRAHQQHVRGGLRPDRRTRDPQRRHDHPRRRTGRRLDLRRRRRHVDVADQRHRHPVGRRPGDRTQQRPDRLHGLRRGRAVRRQLLRRRRSTGRPTAASRGSTCRPCSPARPSPPSPWTRPIPSTCTPRRSAVVAATTAPPAPPPSRTASTSRPTAARPGPCARAPPTRSTARPTS